jgi:ubiquitin-conjugating enzyme E2 S
MNSFNQIHISPHILKILYKQQIELTKNPPDCVIYHLNENDPLDIQADIIGPKSTPYENGIFRVKLVIPNNFPINAPKGYFLTKIFHPNISEKGEICVNTLKRDWNPNQWNLYNVFEVIKCLLIIPFPQSALNEEAGKIFMENYDEYAKLAKFYTNIYAIKPNNNNNNSTNNINNNNNKENMNNSNYNNFYNYNNNNLTSRISKKSNSLKEKRKISLKKNESNLSINFEKKNKKKCNKISKKNINLSTSKHENKYKLFTKDILLSNKNKNNNNNNKINFYKNNIKNITIAPISSITSKLFIRNNINNKNLSYKNIENSFNNYKNKLNYFIKTDRFGKKKMNIINNKNNSTKNSFHTITYN